LDFARLKGLWFRFSLITALTTLLFFAVYGFHSMLLQGKAIYVEPNKYIASLEMSVSVFALSGILYLLMTEHNPDLEKDSSE
jgi:hypothetical protein